MTKRWLLSIGLATALTGPGCAPGPATADGPKRPTVAVGERVATPAPDRTPDPASYYGRVLDLEGRPAAGVEVRGYLIGNNSAGLIGNNSAGLNSDRGSSYRTLAEEPLVARTDAEGVFELAHPDGQPLNVEAVQRADVKAIRLQVPPAATGLTLRLAYTGNISGRVTASDAGISDFEGTDVFIPGTGYVAKAAKDGTYTLAGVPVGTFSITATKLGLGRGALAGVVVASKETTDAPDLVLASKPPVLTSVSPASGLPGTEVTLAGTDFGASTGDIFTVTFGGATATAPRRLDDRTIKVAVPASAKSGDVVVAVNGIPGNARAFQVLQAASIAPRRRELLLGTTFAYASVGVDPDGQTVPDLPASWAVTGEALAVDAEGLVTAKAVGEGTLEMAIGAIKDTLAIAVVSELATVTTLAGDGTSEYADGQGASARFRAPASLAADGTGTLYVVDDRRIRKVTPEGAVSSFTDATKLYADTGLALKNDILNAHLTVGDAGALYFAGGVNQAVVKVGADGRGTLVANFRDLEPLSSPSGIAVADDGTVYVADAASGKLWALAADVEPALVAEGLGAPEGLAIGQDGNVYVADAGGHRIHQVKPTGEKAVFAGGGTAGRVDGAATAARFNGPSAIAVLANGDLLIADANNHVLRRIAMATQTVSTFAGSGERGFAEDTGRFAEFDEPTGLAIGRDGAANVADTANARLRKISVERAATP